MSEQPTFEESLQALEEAVGRLEEGELTLDQALECFEAGLAGAARCRKLLQGVEARVEQLVRDADGALAVEDLDVSGEG